MTHTKNKQNGFTLIESMVTVAVIGILAATAAPSFKGTIEATRARKVSDYVHNMVAYAKSEALNKNKNLYMSVLSDGNLCMSTVSQQASGTYCDAYTDVAGSSSTAYSSSRGLCTALIPTKAVGVACDSYVNPMDGEVCKGVQSLSTVPTGCASTQPTTVYNIPKQEGVNVKFNYEGVTSGYEFVFTRVNGMPRKGNPADAASPNNMIVDEYITFVCVDISSGDKHKYIKVDLFGITTPKTKDDCSA